MSDTSTRGAKQAWAVGGMVLAATLLIMVGIWQVFEGIAAIAKDDVFVRGVSYAYKFNLTTWGWIHLILGALMVIAGFGLFTVATWARVLGIAFAVLSALAQFAFVPYYPLWSLTILAVDVFIIWSLAVARRPIDSDTW
ncbi:MAG TPA: hypothetical protein VGJ63_03990 [Micromonosporaceae bacterium]|jgi:hypothetical protein